MKNKLILIEGIPGAGKTTTARKIKDKLLSKIMIIRLNVKTTVINRND